MNRSTDGETRLLVAMDEAIAFEKYPVEVHPDVRTDYPSQWRDLWNGC
jgi:hypothetical protein